MNTPSRAAAFFDLDGTLLARPSLEMRLIRFLIQRGALGSAQAWHWIGRCARFVICDRERAIAGNKAYLAGLPMSCASDWAATLESEPLPFYKDGLRRMCWHAEQKHPIYLVSGTIALLARIAAVKLPVGAAVCATGIATVNNCWTGELCGSRVCGEEKSRAVARIAAGMGFDLNECFAYGDSLTDAAMLKMVGNPTAVNPSWRLVRVARSSGWQIVHWRKTYRTANLAFALQHDSCARSFGDGA